MQIDLADIVINCINKCINAIQILTSDHTVKLQHIKQTAHFDINIRLSSHDSILSIHFKLLTVDEALKILIMQYCLVILY